MPGTTGETHVATPTRAGRPASIQEGLLFMLRVTCDGCGKELRSGEDHHVVRIEVFAAQDPAELTEADLDEDHMEAVGELLRRLEETEAQVELEPASRRMRYDLCSQCRSRYLRDPLGRETSPKCQFSKN